MSLQPRSPGNGPECPQSAAHGRMLAYPITQRMYCPHADHRGIAIYGWDGTTPIPFRGADTPAAELRASGPVR